MTGRVVAFVIAVLALTAPGDVRYSGRRDVSRRV
jgi:hypothetical protein